MRSIALIAVLLLATLTPDARATTPAVPLMLAHQDAVTAGAAEPAPADAPRSKPRRRAKRPGPVWFNVGLNGSSIDGGEKNCFGGQGGVSFGGPLLVRLQYALLTYENDDDGGDCDGGLYGDSDANERSALLGVSLGRSGLFVAAGPAALDLETTSAGVVREGQDTGTRYELGWNSRHSTPAAVGWEIVAFKNDNDLADFHGLAVNFVFGPRR